MTIWMEELREIGAEKRLIGAEMEDKAIIVRMLLGPLSDTKLLTNQEASYYYCHVARDQSPSAIARDFKISPQRVNEVLNSVQKKIKEARNARNGGKTA